MMRKFLLKIKNSFYDRYFIISFSLSLIIIFFVFFMFYVDFVNRSTLFNDTVPVISLLGTEENTEVKINAFGSEIQMDISFLWRILKAILDFVCIPI